MIGPNALLLKFKNGNNLEELIVACKLKKSAKPGIDFEAKAGDEVQIGVSSDSKAACIVAMVYDGAAVSAPWKFTLVAGDKLLTILVDDPIPRDWTSILEVCNSANSTLIHYPFDPYGPTQSFRIEAQ